MTGADGALGKTVPEPSAAGRRGTELPGKESASSPMLGGTDEGLQSEESGGGELDKGMALIRRKTIAIKSDNVSDVLMSNIGAITESVDRFQQLAEESSANDVALNY